MSLKHAGRIDYQNGRMGWFVCYHRCPRCEHNVKVILPTNEYNHVCHDLGRHLTLSPREITKRVLIGVVDKLDKNGIDKRF